MLDWSRSLSSIFGGIALSDVSRVVGDPEIRDANPLRRKLPQDGRNLLISGSSVRGRLPVLFDARLPSARAVDDPVRAPQFLDARAGAVFELA